MKITDPSLDPDQFGTLAFESVDDDPRGPEVFALTVNNVPVGELAPLGFANLGLIVLDDDDCVLPPDGCWSLELAAADGRLRGSHILCTGSELGVAGDTLSGELAVWATLMVTWDATGRPRQRG